MLIFLALGATAAQDFQPDEQIVYKKTPQGELKLHVFYPKGEKEGMSRPAIVFFFGGGWQGGTPRQFYAQCAYLAAQGMVAMAAEYRVYNTHGTTPFECVKDGKSAIRWVRKNAEMLGIDTGRVIAGGGSAGGHVAATTAFIEGFEEGENLDQSAVPDALVLFNPALNTGGERFIERLGVKSLEISPVHHIRENLPPCIIFHGTADNAVPYSQVEEFQRKMSDKGNLCLLITSVGQAHSYFNNSHFADRFDNAYFNKTIYETHFFFKEIGMLEHFPGGWLKGWPEDLR